MSKTVYQTNALGHYTGPTEADESPLEPGVFLIPAGCVEESPAIPGAHQWPAWIDGAWTFVPDFRGTVGYDRSTGEPVTVTELGKTLAELNLSPTPIPDPRLGQVAGGARIARREARTQAQAQKLNRRGDTLGALKLLNHL